MKEILRVFTYCTRYKLLATGMMLCAVASTLFGILYPKLTGIIIDDILAGGKAEQLGLMTGAVLASFFLRDLLNFVRLRLNNTFEHNVVYDIRTQLYDKLQRLPLAWYDDRAGGDLMTRVSEDVLNMERGIIDGIEQGTIAVLQIFAVGAILFYMNVELALCVILPLPFLALGAALYTTAAHRQQRVVRRATSAMNSLLLDNLQGIMQIKSFGREQREFNRFAAKARELRAAVLKGIWIWSYYSPSMAFISSVGIVLVLYFGGREVLRPEPAITVGQLASFLLYVGMFYAPMERLHMLNGLFQAMRAAAERVFKILDTPSEPDAPAAAARHLPSLAAGGRRVEFRDVAFAYDPAHPTLRDINLIAEPGQTVALVGPTGAGKSTVVGLIPRFYRAAAGAVLIDGVPVNDIPLDQLREQIGIVSQESFLFNTTVRENLLFGRPDADEDQLRTALAAANALDFVTRLPRGLDTNVGENGIKLSVGEKQRLSFARALLKDPPVLILDEATASVDTATERLIQEALEHLLRNRTSFVIAHRLSTIRRADLICVLKHGKIIERGTHNELLDKNGLYAALCRAQTLGETNEETFKHLGQ